MKRTVIALEICALISVFLCGCGTQPEETATEIASETQEERIVSELEIQIEEFKANTPSEVTVTQDLLRGVWRCGDLFEGTYTCDKVKMGNVEIDYDTNSKYTSWTFTNDEFVLNYENPTILYEGDRLSKRGSVRICGLYRVVKEVEFEDSTCARATIELLPTEVTVPYGQYEQEILDELNSVVGKVMERSIGFGLGYQDYSFLSEEELEEMDFEPADQVIHYTGGEFGYRADGSYGIILYDEPIASYGSPITHLYFDDGDMISKEWYMKMKTSVSDANGPLEDGIQLYHAIPEDMRDTAE